MTLHADGGVRVEDNGRGIPTDTAPGQGMPAVTMALTMLHAGGKFGGGGYKVSGGLHGVGVSVVNALSSTLQVDVRNRGYHWRQTFSLGEPDGPLEQLEALEPGDETGTTVTYWASDDIFETTTYSLETITNRIREYAFLNKGLEIIVRDERPHDRRLSRTPSRTTPSRWRRPSARHRPTRPWSVTDGRGRRAPVHATTRASSTTSSTSTSARTRRTPASSTSRPSCPTAA